MERGVNNPGLADERKVISSQITITNSEIRGKIKFSNAHFQKDINFIDAEFYGEVDFLGAQFSRHSLFCKARFGCIAIFIEARFSCTANFSDARFSCTAGFIGAQFSDGGHFPLAQFGGNAEFSGARFSGASFWLAQFTGNAEFHVAQFNGDTHFFEARFGSNASFHRALFSGDVDFHKAHFCGSALFFEARFGGYVNFRETQFDYYLILTNVDFNQLYISWDSIKDKLVCNGPIFLKLIKNFKIIEQFNDADACYYQYRKESQAQKKWYIEENRLIEFLVRCYSWTSAKIRRISEYLSWINDYPPFTWIHRFNWSKLLDWIGFVSCGYGVRIQPIILWVLASVLSFTLLYKLLPQSYGGIAESGPSTVTMEVVNNSTLLLTFGSGDGAVSPSWGECLYFSFTALTGGTPDGLHPVGLAKYAVMVEGVLGYLFLALFVVVLARKIIR